MSKVESKTVRVELFNGDVVMRAVRRIHRKDDGLEYGWTSLSGKDVKVFRAKRRRTWELVSK